MNDENRKKFGQEIKLRRLAKGWDQYELARRVGSSAATIGRWENAITIPQRSHYVIALKRELGFTEDDFLKAFGSLPSRIGRNGDGFSYTACSFATAADRLGSFEALYGAREVIENEWPVPMEPGEYGTNEMWLELLCSSPESGGVVFHHGTEVVGFWESLAVTDETYEAILRGENVNKTISLANIVTLLHPETYKMYFVSLFLRKIHNNIPTRNLLIKDFLEFLCEAAEQGIFFDRIAANITGVVAREQCQGLGFRKVIDHQVHRCLNRQMAEVPAEIFELVIGPDAKRLFSHNSRLRDLYIAQGLFDSNDR